MWFEVKEENNEDQKGPGVYVKNFQPSYSGPHVKDYYAHPLAAVSTSSPNNIRMVPYFYYWRIPFQVP
jgi:hypothetical protein